MRKKILILSLLWMSFISFSNLVQAESNARIESSSSNETVSSENLSEEEIGVWDLSFNHLNKTLTGKTEANADVFVLANDGEGTYKADENGNFSCELALAKAGDMLKISAGYNYKFGTPVEFTIPSDKKEISIWDLSFNHSNKTLTGKTEANADVFVLADDGEGTYKADENGNFSCELALAKAGDMLKISAGYNYKFGTPVEFIIPDEEHSQSGDRQENGTTNNSTVPNTELSQSSEGNKVNSKKNLPSTGVIENKIIEFVGIYIVAMCCIFFVKKYTEKENLFDK